MRRIGRLTNFVFKSDADLEVCMDIIEECRQMSIYPHSEVDCTTECKERGMSCIDVATMKSFT